MQPDKLYARYCELQRYINWTPKDAERVRQLAPIAQQHFAGLINDFYEAIQHNPSTTKVITGGEQQIARLKGTLVRWLEELFSGSYDQAYVLRRWKVGLRHVEIGLDQVYTNAALSRLRDGLLMVLEKVTPTDDQEIMTKRRSLNKLLDLDLAIIEEAYQTERERRQQQIERLATIGQVAGGVAHELRNPLNVIKTSTYYLRKARAVSAEKLATHLERIDRQAVMADGVISALNNFARLPVPERKPFDAAVTIQEILELNALPETIEATIDLPSSFPAVLGDPQQLSIVFTNLIRNARDAMPTGGRLKVSGRHMDTCVEIDVADNGAGIAPENLSRIMEPLFSTKARGIGLGLAISRAIIDKHDGQLRVRSAVGEGSTFTVRLAAAPASHSEESHS